MFKRIILHLIIFYQKIISPITSTNACLFYPTCSEYMYQSIVKYGVLRGIYRGIKRIIRCHPLISNPGVDLP